MNEADRTSDELEQHTRQAYGQAAAAAIAIVAAAVPESPPRRREDWPDGRARAVAAGWIVTPGPASTSAVGGRLAGMPIAVKDVIDVAGLPTRNGTPGLAWRDPEVSAPAWQRLADEGAVCVGKAATHELAWGVTTATVPHPHDATRMPGGSSGGSAACVAAGAAAAALGTDTGGSIRIPAALCGVVGMRPTTGSVPTNGVTPLAPSQDVVGPIAPDVETCRALAEVLLGDDLDIDPLPPRIGVIGRVGDLDGPVAAAWAAVVARLTDSGVEVVTVDDVPLKLAASLSLLTMLRESNHVHGAAAARLPCELTGEIRALVGVGEDHLVRTAPLAAARRVLGRQTADLFATYGVAAVLTPTTPCVAPLREAVSVELAGRTVPVATALTRFTSWASAAGLPAVSVPWWGGPLPVGIQVVAPRHRDAVSLAVAGRIEALAAPRRARSEGGTWYKVCKAPNEGNAP